MKRLGLALLAFATLAPSAAYAQSRAETLHAVPIRYADRPLTLPEGSIRLDQSISLRAGSLFGVSAPNQLSAGLTDWLEIGVAWPWTRDPTFLATARIAHTDAVDFGVRVAVTVPALTTGDTDLIVSMPIVFRIAHVARIATGVSGDFLLTQTMHPIVRVPLSIAFSMGERRAIGLEGSISLVDRHFWHGDIGLFFAHTPSATAIRPIGEVRLGASWEFASSTFVTTVGFSFWGTVLPTSG